MRVILAEEVAFRMLLELDPWFPHIKELTLPFLFLLTLDGSFNIALRFAVKVV